MRGRGRSGSRSPGRRGAWLLGPVLCAAACASGSSGSTEPGNTGTAANAASGGAGMGQPPGDQPPGGGAFANPSAGSPGSGTGSRDLGGCNDLAVQFEPVTPSVLLLVDRSGSMWDAAYGSSPTRWDAIHGALMDPASGVVPAFQHEVRFGLMTYTSNTTAGMCPLLDQVPPALDNYDAIRPVYETASTRPSFKADTPTAAGLRAATELLRSLPDDPDKPGGPKLIVLITDGEPDTCATPDPSCGQDESVAAVQAAFAEGISTFVIGISDDVSRQHLQDLANAGLGMPVRAPDMQFTYNCINPGYATLSASYAGAGEQPGNADVYQPADRDAIASALRAVIRGVHGCTFRLHGEVDLEHADLGAVLLDGQALTYEDAHGWRMRDARTLELVGDACTRVQLDASELLVSFPCDVVDVL